MAISKKDPISRSVLLRWRVLLLSRRRLRACGAA